MSCGGFWFFALVCYVFFFANDESTVIATARWFGAIVMAYRYSTWVAVEVVVWHFWVAALRRA